MITSRQFPDYSENAQEFQINSGEFSFYVDLPLFGPAKLEPNSKMQMAVSWCFDLKLIGGTGLNGVLSFYLINSLSNSPSSVRQKSAQSIVVKNGCFPDGDSSPNTYENQNKLLVIDNAFSCSSRYLTIEWKGEGASTPVAGVLSMIGHIIN